MMVAAMLLALPAWAGVRGDADGSGVVDIDDVNLIINVMLGKSQHAGTDVNGNGFTDVEDLNIVINVIVGKDTGDVETKTFTVNGVSFKMVTVEGGTFTMGTNNTEFDWEMPAHQVTLSDFSIGQTEVTQELWIAVMGDNPSWYKAEYGYEGNLQRPV